MSSQTDSLAEQASLELMSKEVEFFRNFAFDSVLEPIRPIAAFALMPFMASFVFDSAKYLREEDSAIAQAPATVSVLEEYEEQLSRSRLRLKFSDSKNRSLDAILKDDYAMMSTNNALLGETHGGFLGPLKNLLQANLGVYFSQGKMVCTTHIALLDLGLDDETLTTTSLDDLGPYLHDRSEGYGQYMGLLMRSLGVEAPVEVSTNSITVTPLGYRDLKGKRFYESMARQVSPLEPSVGLRLMAILARINTARIIAPQVASADSMATFKIQFLSLFHAASCLDDLLQEERGGRFLHNDAIDQICTVLGTDAVARVRGHYHLRNVLVHYRVAKRRRHLLSTNLPLSGLVEAHTDGASRTAIASDVEAGLASVAAGLGSLMPRTLTPRGTL
jgi:hypothetical protein